MIAEHVVMAALTGPAARDLDVAGIWRQRSLAGQVDGVGSRWRTSSRSTKSSASCSSACE